MTDNFFPFESEAEKELYNSIKDLPIIDYHNHLSLNDITEDRRFLNVYDLWVKPDPYKHRAMRMCGVPEDYITGGAPERDKFKKWCETLSKLYLNPLSFWSVMELQTVFGIKENVNADNSDEIYDRCNEYLKSHPVTAMSLLNDFNVELACPCVSVLDDASVFLNAKNIAPSLRGDDIVGITPSFVEKLGNAANMKINKLGEFFSAIETRLLQLKKVGCVFSDHALDNGFAFIPDDGKNGERFSAMLSGSISDTDRCALSSFILLTLGKLYAKHGFVLQLHIGAQRYTSTKLRSSVGAAGGFACIGNSVDVSSLTKLFDNIESGEYGLPKIVLFTLNPSDNAIMSVLSGSYSKDGTAGIITQGPAWWWCDHTSGIREVLESSASYGVLYNFLGMTTDSRSFLSFVRHDYFRRLLSKWLAEKWEKREFLCDFNSVKELAKKLSYQNAKDTVLIKS